MTNYFLISLIWSVLVKYHASDFAQTWTHCVRLVPYLKTSIRYFTSTDLTPGQEEVNIELESKSEGGGWLGGCIGSSWWMVCA